MSVAFSKKFLSPKTNYRDPPHHENYGKDPAQLRVMICTTNKSTLDVAATGIAQQSFEPVTF